MAALAVGSCRARLENEPGSFWYRSAASSKSFRLSPNVAYRLGGAIPMAAVRSLIDVPTNEGDAMARLEGKTALVTGGSRGIGRAISERLAADGALVAVHGRDATSGGEVVSAIAAAGGRAFAIGADLSPPNGPEALFALLDAELRQRTGSTDLDILVANAGIARPGSLASTSAEWFDELFAVNTRSIFFLLQQAQDRLAVGRRGITVNTVAPGVIDTDMNASWLRASVDARDAVSAMSPFNRIGAPADVADAVAFLVSSDARWVTGQYLDATGGALL